MIDRILDTIIWAGIVFMLIFAIGFWVTQLPGVMP
jgi:hypothetical protein